MKSGVFSQGSNSINSALTPAGPVAESVADLYWMMIYVFGATFVLVIVLSALAIWLKNKAGENTQAPLGDTRFILIGGIAFPTVVLTFFLIYTLLSTQKVFSVPDNAIRIEVTGYMWWWEVKYPDSGIEIANEIYVPAGRPVHLILNSADVIHSLWVPSLAGKMDLLPGIENDMWFQAKEPGLYRGQCAEYCGLQHARMSIYVVALKQEEFNAWVDQRRQPPAPPTDPLLLQGKEVFKTAGCAECHAIKGTEYNGQIGPDLTHIGSRLSLGAGTIPNSHGNLAGWIAQPQALKPGNKMPAAYIEPKEFKALVEYLKSLK